MNQVEELERALIARAERLASAYREMTQRSRDNTLREASERLRLREQREEAIARSLGERHFRQQVQASEIKLQSHLDRVRWNLVTDVEARLRDRLRTYMMEQEEAYHQTLERYLAQAANHIEADDLIAEVNAHDHQRLAPLWETIASRAAPAKCLRLAERPIQCLGGVRVSSADQRIRVDNTFEGRLERLRVRIQQVILERLLPGGLDTSNLFGG